jgi:tmRNA-binding protein
MERIPKSLAVIGGGVIGCEYASIFMALGVKVAQRGMTLVPLALYLTNGKVKLELGLARGKEGVDKRHSIAQRDARRQMERAVKERNSR